MFRLSLLALVFGWTGSSIAQTYSFTPFACDGPGADDTRAFGINDSNLIVGACRSMGLHGFIYDGVSIQTPVEPPGAVNSRIRGVNDAAVMVGFYRGAGNAFFRGFMRINEFTYRDVVPPDAAGDSLALGINSLNQVVGGYTGADGNQHGFVLDGEHYVGPLDCPGSLNTVVAGGNDAGQIAGSCDDGVTTTAAIYDFNTSNLILFQCPGAADTGVMGINNSGVIAGWFDTPDTTHGFVSLDMGQSCLQIDYPDAPNTQVNGINSSGSLVGFYFDDDVNYIRSFVATPN